MKNAALALVLWVAIVTSAIAQGPTSVVGPKQANVGDLVILDATSFENAETIRWLLVNSDKTFLPVDGGKRLVFASGEPFVYKFILIVGSKGADDKVVIEVAEHEVTIGNPPPAPTPTPTPTPTPNPTPGPSFPDGKFKLSAWAYAEAMKLGPVPRAKAAAIADCFASTATLINPPDPNLDGYRTVEEVLAETIRCNREAAGDQRDNWLPWFTALDEKLTALSVGELKSLDDHKTAWNEISEGLRKVN